jgi:hypothetical protein
MQMGRPSILEPGLADAPGDSLRFVPGPGLMARCVTFP